MIIDFESYTIESIHEKYAWRICDFCTTNAKRLQRFFPKTLEQNLTPDLSKNFVERKVKEFEAKEEFLFVLKEKKNHTLIGLVYVKEIDWIKKQGELAYCIDYKVEGKGYTTQTVKVISKWAFEVLELKTLQIIVHKTNIGSVRVAEKCGYIRKKTLLKAYTPPNGDPKDMELYELSA